MSGRHCDWWIASMNTVWVLPSWKRQLDIEWFLHLRTHIYPPNIHQIAKEKRKKEKGHKQKNILVVVVVVFSLKLNYSFCQWSKYNLLYSWFGLEFDILLCQYERFIPRYEKSNMRYYWNAIDHLCTTFGCCFVLYI